MEIAGILSLVFGVIGLIGSYWYVGIILCAVGITLGIVNFTDSLAEKKFGVAGFLISILGVVMSIYFFVSDVDAGRLIVLWIGKNETTTASTDKDVRNVGQSNSGWNPDVNTNSGIYQNSTENETSRLEENKTEETPKTDTERVQTQPEELVAVQPEKQENSGEYNIEPREEEPEIKQNTYGNKGTNYSAKSPVFYTYGDNTGDVHYWFMQEITNNGGTPLYLKDCPIDIVDNNGHLIDTEDFILSCPDVIYPGEKGYFYNGIGSLTLNESVRSAGSLNVIPHIDVVESDENPAEYEVSDTSLTKDTLGLPSVIGRVTNRTGEDDSLLYLNVIFYNRNGDVVFISGVNVMDLYAGTTKSFECSAMGIPDDVNYEDIANYKVIARKSHFQF